MDIRAGLCAIDVESQKIVVVERKKSYSNAHIFRCGEFVEKYQIPRGRCCEESIKNCAIREFIEETGLFFKEYTILNMTFDLFWEDPIDTFWKYKIYFCKTSLDPNNIIRITENTFNGMKLNVRSRRFEPLIVRIMYIQKYIDKLNNQLIYYMGQHNYKDFIEIIKNES